MTRKIILLIVSIIILSLATFAQSKQFLNIEYAKVDTSSLKLDLYLPNQPTENIPLIVWIHGGAWVGGDKSPLPQHVSYFLARGYAAASINYRLSQQAIFPAQIHDCKAAIRWLRANAAQYNLSTERIGVWGSSAGGHLVALLGTSGNIPEMEGTIGGNLEYSSSVQAVCDWFGPSDLLREIGYPSSIDRNSPDCPEAKLIGGKLSDNPDKAKAASPITYVTSEDPPFMIMHGTVDNTVPYTQSVFLDSALRYNHVASTFIPMVGCGHGWPKTATDSIIGRIYDFFERYIKYGASDLTEYNFDKDLIINVFPNPTNSIISVSCQIKIPGFVEFDIYNVYGVLLLKKQGKYINSGLCSERINMEEFPTGSYFIKFRLNDKYFVKPFILLE